VPPIQPDTIHNHLLTALPREQRARLLAVCEPVQLVPGEVLCEAGGTQHHVYFPEHGIISLVKRVNERTSLEVGLIGYEGMYGASLVLGVALSPLRAQVHGAGQAQRIGAAPFHKALQDDVILRDLLVRYVHVVLAQMSQLAACTLFHVLQARLARWLLMTRDRAQSDHFHVTHEFLALMLGVRRVGVTKAAVSLHELGLINYHRGDITILDGPGLEAAACGCYAQDRMTYADTMHPDPEPLVGIM
jgi:CRP-like cAMP-binding protein